MRPDRRGQLSLGQTLLLLLLGIALLYGTIALGAVLRVVAQGITFDEGLRQVTSEPLGPALAQLLALGAVVLVGVRLAYGDTSLRDALRIVPVRPQVAALAMLAGLSLQFPLVELTSVISDMVPAIAFDEDQLRELERITRIDGPLRAITVTLALVVIAPISEELVFRGLLLPALRPRLGTAAALLSTAVLFGAFHLHPLVLVYASVAGVVLGAIALRTGSVLPSIAFHAAFNAVPLVLPEQVLPIRGFNVGQGEHLSLPFVLATGATGLIALAILWWITASEPAAD